MTLTVLAKPPGFKPQARVAKASLYRPKITATILSYTAHFTCPAQNSPVAHIQTIKTPQSRTKRALQSRQEQEIN